MTSLKTIQRSPKESDVVFNTFVYHAGMGFEL